MSKANFRRKIHEAHKHYTSVLMQQGRVALDEDWNDEDANREMQRIIRLSTKVLTPVNLRRLGLGVVAEHDIDDLVRNAADESGQPLSDDDVSVIGAMALAFLEARIRSTVAEEADTRSVLAHKHFGIHRGEVVDNIDPQAHGRVKVRLPIICSGLELWALPSVPVGMDVGRRKRWVPDVGAVVWVMFEDGDPNHPVWIGTAPGI